jgi:hypothetical protein
MTSKYKDLLLRASGDLLRSVEELVKSYVSKNDESPVAAQARQAIAKATGAIVFVCQLQGCGTKWIATAKPLHGRPRTKYCSDFCCLEANRATATERQKRSRQRKREKLKNDKQVTA